MTSGFKRYKRGLVFCLLSVLLVSTKGYTLDKKVSLSLSHFITALMYDRLGDIDRAIQEYKKALKVDYKNSTIHLNLASSYIKKNELDKAIEN